MSRQKDFIFFAEAVRRIKNQLREDELESIEGIICDMEIYLEDNAPCISLGRWCIT